MSPNERPGADPHRAAADPGIGPRKAVIGSDGVEIGVVHGDVAPKHGFVPDLDGNGADQRRAANADIIAHGEVGALGHVKPGGAEGTDWIGGRDRVDAEIPPDPDAGGRVDTDPDGAGDPQAGANGTAAEAQLDPGNGRPPPDGDDEGHVTEAMEEEAHT